jgi:sensor histidine kinase regulating citrate/malate metabolism
MRFSWIKDSLIQIVFINLAVIFTVIIAQITISEQYTEYYETKLESKADSLARNAARLFTQSGEIRNAEGMRYCLRGYCSWPLPQPM